MIDLARFTPWSFDSVKKYEWDRERFRGRTLYEKILGIVGMGRLGAWMARYGMAFGMEVLFCDPHVSETPVPGCQKVSFEKLLKESDAVSLHAHCTDETRNMFDAAAFEKMKRTAYLINTAQGGIVDESALLRALMTRKIAGYAADVLTDDPTPNPLAFSENLLVEYARAHNNVIIVPRTGGMTHESRECTDVFIAEKLARHFSSYCYETA